MISPGGDFPGGNNKSFEVAMQQCANGCQQYLPIPDDQSVLCRLITGSDLKRVDREDHNHRNNKWYELVFTVAEHQFEEGGFGQLVTGKQQDGSQVQTMESCSAAKESAPRNQ